MTSLFAKLSKGYKIASPGAGVAVLSFFLPWFLVSCSGVEISMSGWNLAAGMILDSGFGEAEYVPGNPIIFLTLIAGVLILTFAYASTRRQMPIALLDGVGVALLSFVALIITLWAMASLEREAEMQGLTVSYQIGLWGVLFGYIASFAGGLMNLAPKQSASALPSALPLQTYNTGESPTNQTKQSNS